MFKPIQSILLATDLSQSCIPAFEMAAAMATTHQATLVLLHVLQQKMPSSVELRLKAMFGDQGYEDLLKNQTDSARQALIGKKSSSALVRAALNQYCTNVGIDDDSCEYQSREIVVTEGNLVDEVIATAEKHACDLIVMGVRDGFFKDNTIGANIKSVMRKSRIPVMMVPPEQK